MRLLLLLLSVIAGAIVAVVVRRTRAIARLTRRIEADVIERRSSYPTIVVLPARHLRTTQLGQGIHLNWIGVPPGAIGELGVTERELVLVADHELARIPLTRVCDAAFVSEFEGQPADSRLTFLRVVWTRGGEQLATTFGLDTTWPQAEKLRREVHMRSGTQTES